MKELLQKAVKAGLLLDIVDGKLKLFTEVDEVDSEILDQIKQNKDEITQYLIQNNINSIFEEVYTNIPLVTEAESYTLSHGQRRLWLTCQFEAGSGAYNIPEQIYFNQELDIPCFKKAVEAVIIRHEILRTVFRYDSQGELRQWILTPADLNFKIGHEDFRQTLTPAVAAEAYITIDSHKPFDLENGPLLRAALLQIAESEYIFYYNMHHIISDGWSSTVLTKDVFTYYQAFIEGKTPELEPLRIQYKDYAAWQWTELETENFQIHKAFWLEQLEGELPLIDLPSNKKRPALKSYNGGSVGINIEADLTQHLANFVAENGGSAFMGLLAVWNILMYRYTMQKDFIIGSPVAGREHADLNDQIGFYINALALRNKIEDDYNFEQFYSKVKDNTIKSFNHQMYPFDCLVEDLELRRDTSRSPVFDISISYHNIEEGNENATLSQVDPNLVKDFGEVKVKNDIELHVQEIGNYLTFTAGYNSDVYDKEMIKQLLLHFKQLLRELLVKPELKLSQIDFLLASEKQQLLVEFNNTEKALPTDKTIIELFQEQVKQVPTQTAVNYNDVSLTYKELDDLSNRFANYLRASYNLQPDDLIGIQLERSEQMMVAILGVLKTGAAYVPIDPEYPTVRKEFIVSDSNAKILITESSFIFDFEYFNGNICVMDIEFDPTVCSSNPLPKLGNANNLAYVIYTSGSTGKPKGVMIEHKAIINTLLSHIDVYKVDRNTNGLLFASFSFDASISEGFINLLTGSPLFIATEKHRKDPNLLVDYMQENEIHVASLPPSYVSTIEMSALSGLKTLITAGDASPYKKALQFHEYGTYINGYGPTETSVCGTLFKLENTETGLIDTFPVGKPIYNTQIYLLDENENLQPLGATGEICIGGNGLARGYLNRPELTQEKFIRNPFIEGGRIYKTGDLGKWLPDGNLVFMGRFDDQVKVRGYRIELGEIQQTLEKHLAIEMAVVLVNTPTNKEKEIGAYFKGKSKLNASELNLFLKERLPEYMLPTYYVQLDEMPLTPNGKVDKKALLNYEGGEILVGASYVAPTNQIEKQLIEIWEEILEKEKIGINDNFFELGGNSLKAIILGNKIEQNFQVKLKIEKILSTATIELIANEIKALQWVEKSKEEENSNEREIIEL